MSASTIKEIAQAVIAPYKLQTPLGTTPGSSKVTDTKISKTKDRNRNRIFGLTKKGKKRALNATKSKKKATASTEAESSTTNKGKEPAKELEKESEDEAEVVYTIGVESTQITPKQLTWATDAGWMKPTLGLGPTPDSSETKTISLLSAAKVSYILNHELTLKDMTKLLRAAGIDNTGSAAFLREKDKLGDHQSRFQGTIMADFIYPRVALIILEWYNKKSSAGKTFEGLKYLDRQDVWRRDFMKDPMGNASSMWGHVGSVIPWEQVYNDTLSLEEDKEVLREVRDMFGAKWLHACETTFKYRYASPDENMDDELKNMSQLERCYAGWKGFRYVPEFLKITVPFDKLPVVPTAGTDRKNKSSSIAIPKGNDYAATIALLNEDIVYVYESEDDQFDPFA